MSDKEWEGKFGIDYTRRNKIDPYKLRDFFKSIIPNDVHRILEVGCNRGHNLEAIFMCGDYDLYGIDISLTNIIIARSRNIEITYKVGDIFHTGYESEEFDLNFIAGVLIHVNPDELDDAIIELIDNTKKYLLILEYNYPKFVQIRKRAYKTEVQLWKGPYKKKILESGIMKLIKEGEVGPEQGFGDTRNYYLFKKVNI